MNQVLYLNGDFMPLADGRVAITDRGFQFADGVYDVIRVYNGVPFCMRDHLERITRSLRMIDIEPTIDIGQMENICLDILRRSGETDCAIYGQITRGAATRNHKYPPAGTPGTILFYNTPVNKMPEPDRRRGVKVSSHPDIRWKMCDIKSVALLPNVLLKNRAMMDGYFETLLLDENNLVSEGAVCNAFAIKNGTIHTAPNGPRILPGITRKVILQVAQAIGIPIIEEFQTIEFFKTADEVFLSSTTMEIMPVNSVEERKIGSGQAGPLTWQIFEAYQRRIARECDIAKSVS